MRALERVHLKDSLFASARIRRVLSGPDDPKYAVILDSRPHPVNRDSGVEVHMLLCERDFLRGVWALKSFLHCAGFDPRVVIHDDGTLSASSRRSLEEHFVGCEIPANAEERCLEALSAYPMCSLFRRTHVISQKLFDVLTFARGDYVMVMDSDVLWYRRSEQIQAAAAAGRPFYLQGGSEAYARNRRFMEEHCRLQPASNVNTGIVGFRPSELRDFAFLDDALDKLIHVPAELLDSSLGYRHFGRLPGYDPSDPAGSIVWWVMEQTLYALLLGRRGTPLGLQRDHGDGGGRHVFIGYPIDERVALQHFISDPRWNAFFPIGAHHLLESGFLDRWNQAAPSSLHNADSSGSRRRDQS